MSIDLNPTPEQREIVEALRNALAKEFPAARLRDPHAHTTRFTTDTHRLPVLAELGAFGILAPERVGGLGLDLVEAMLVCVEFGRHLVTPTAMATMLAARLAAALGQDTLAGAIATGERRVAVANALTDCDIHHLHGVPAHLVDGGDAPLALLWNDSGIVLLHGEALQAESIPATDRSVVLQRCVLGEQAVAGRLSAEKSSLAQEAHLLLCAQLLGMAETARDLAVDYAKTREQFGRPIGSFQAIKHRCADMAIAARALRAQLGMAMLALHGGWPDAGLQVDACRLLATRTALANAAACIQIHGGMGFTAECDAHLYLLRAHLYEHLGGPRGALLQRLSTPRATATERSVAP